jgi:hypothetical protein
VIAEHAHSTNLAEEAKHASGVRPASDEVAHEEHPVVRPRTDAIQQMGKLHRASVDVTDIDVARHRELVGVGRPLRRAGRPAETLACPKAPAIHEVAECHPPRFLSLRLENLLAHEARGVIPVRSDS